MRTALLTATAALAIALPAVAQQEPKGAPTPSEIVAAAPRTDWVQIPAQDVLIMTLAPDAEGNPRTVVIQLMPAPFSQGWIHNIRLLARARWYDGISVNRVQDNYVVQWGDPNYDNPEATGTPKPLPQGLKVMAESEYGVTADKVTLTHLYTELGRRPPRQAASPVRIAQPFDFRMVEPWDLSANTFLGGFAFTALMKGELVEGKLHTEPASIWPTHCYGMVGVGRNMSPDTGSGAELYTVIGHAPRHLDRNIALVGRVIEGMEHLSSLPRGKGALGFYAANEAGRRTPILSVRVASDLAPAEQPRFEYLSTTSQTFAAYAEAIANRRDPFFITPAGGADICNIRVPVRRVE